MDENYAANAYILKWNNDNEHILVEKVDDKYSIVTNVDLDRVKGKLFAIHKKDEEVLNAYLKDPKVKIQWYTNYGDYPYFWDDYYIDFLENYDEQETYRLKIL